MSFFNKSATGASSFGLNTNATNTQPSQPSTGFGFGQSTNTTQQTSNVFGGATTSSQPQQSGGFGSSTNATTSTGLFGGAQNQNQAQAQAQAQQSGSAFGNLGSQQNKPVFGQSLQSQPVQQSSLFGSSTNASQPQQHSMFGANTSVAPKPSFLSNTATNQNAQSQSQAVPGVKIDLSNLRGTTRFGDLHEDLQRVIENIDNFILQQIQFKEKCDALVPKHEEQLSFIPNDVEFASRKLETVKLALENDAASIDHVRNLVKKDTVDAKLSFRAVENLKLPQQYHYTSLWNAPPPTVSPPISSNLDEIDQAEEGPKDIVSYVAKEAEDMGRTLDTYKATVQEIEAHLRRVEGNVTQQIRQHVYARGPERGESNAEDQVRQLAVALKQFEQAIFGVASRVGEARENVQELELGPVSARSVRNGRKLGI